MKQSGMLHNAGGHKDSKKRGNGHKMNCRCPICKNMRKSKKHGGAKGEEPYEGFYGDEDPDEDEIIENENADEGVHQGQGPVDAIAQDPYDPYDSDEDQNGGKKHKKKSRKSRNTKRRSSKRKGRKTKRRLSKRK